MSPQTWNLGRRVAPLPPLSYTSTDVYIARCVHLYAGILRVLYIPCTCMVARGKLQSESPIAEMCNNLKWKCTAICTGQAIIHNVYWLQWTRTSFNAQNCQLKWSLKLFYPSWAIIQSWWQDYLPCVGARPLKAWNVKWLCTISPAYNWIQLSISGILLIYHYLGPTPWISCVPRPSSPSPFPFSCSHKPASMHERAEMTPHYS